MATASIIFNTVDENAISVVRIDNRGSTASLETDLGEAFASFSSIDLSNPPRIGARVIAWYAENKSTVKAEAPSEPNWDDSTHVLLDCSTADSAGRPTGTVSIPSTGEEDPLVYGG
tara:strand:+ start:147 stop:494 length:348 start_codon:yes stop_codon:yes gene_type:complete